MRERTGRGRPIAHGGEFGLPPTRIHRRGIGLQLLQAQSPNPNARLSPDDAVIGDSANAGSIGVHARTGFQMIGTHPSVGFKFGRWLDTVMMQRALGDGGTTLPADSKA